ncbi:MAG: aspartate-semialdehyde dehydrogenase, partial [Planctomycetota bacterium]
MSARTVAIVGATGAVGQDFLTVLAQRNFPLRSLRLYASLRSAGQRMTFCGESLTVEALGPDSFRGVDVALFSAGG